MISQGFEKNPDSDEFEAGIANLMWVLGFSVIHLGSTDKTTKAADVLASTPNGNILVLECTTGSLKSDKVSILEGRAKAIRQSLVASGNSHLRVLAAIVTSRPLEEVRIRRDEVLKEGILVLTREDFKASFDRTLLYPNADRIFTEGEARLRIEPTPASLVSGGVQ